MKEDSLSVACCEFLSLRMAALMGIKVPSAWLFLPSDINNAVGIQWLDEESFPSDQAIQENDKLRYQMVSSVITHTLFEDYDNIDFVYHNGDIYTFDFGEAMRVSDTYIDGLMRLEKSGNPLLLSRLEQLFGRKVPDYEPNMLVAYEMLVNDENSICTSEYFADTLQVCCSNFLKIPQSAIEELLLAIGQVYPQKLIPHLRSYIEQIRAYCQEAVQTDSGSF